MKNNVLGATVFAGWNSYIREPNVRPINLVEFYQRKQINLFVYNFNLKDFNLYIYNI